MIRNKKEKMRHVVFLLTSFLLAYVSAATPNLVIYTYEGIFAVNGFDFVGAFATAAGLNASTIYVHYVDDANAIVTSAINPPAGIPLPDLLLGLDNVLQLDIASNLLLSYNSPQLAYIRSDIKNALQLSNAAALTPYDFSQIVITVDINLLQTKFPDYYTLVTSPSFSLQTFIDHPAMFSQLILESPITSGTGINFLMWTIAVFGDPTLGLAGSRGTSGNWRTFWRMAVQYNSPVFADWSDAFSALGQYPMVISYSTDAAYPVCTNQTVTYTVYGSNDDGTAKAWQNIEAAGIMKSIANETARVTLAQQFIDWLLMEPMQSMLPLDDYTLPVRVNTSLPGCYNGSTIFNIPSVNSYLNAPTIQTHLPTWLNEIQQILTTPTPTPTPTTGTQSPTPSNSGKMGAPWMVVVIMTFVAMAMLVIV